MYNFYQKEKMTMPLCKNMWWSWFYALDSFFIDMLIWYFFLYEFEICLNLRIFENFILKAGEIWIIESKQSDKKKTTDKKWETWLKLSNCLNTHLGTTFSAEQCSEKRRAHKKSNKDASTSEAAQKFRTGNLSLPADTKMSEAEARTHSLLKSQLAIPCSKSTFSKSSEEVELLSPPSKNTNWSARSCSKYKSMQQKKKLH